MLSQPSLGLAFALLKSRALGNRQPAQSGQIAAARAGLAKLFSESLTFETVYVAGGKNMHKAPVENREVKVAKRRTKSKQYFRFLFAIVFC
jgi:hypothetical protein